MLVFCWTSAVQMFYQGSWSKWQRCPFQFFWKDKKNCFLWCGWLQGTNATVWTKKKPKHQITLDTVLIITSWLRPDLKNLSSGHWPGPAHFCPEPPPVGFNEHWSERRHGEQHFLLLQSPLRPFTTPPPPFHSTPFGWRTLNTPCYLHTSLGTHTLACFSSCVGTHTATHKHAIVQMYQHSTSCLWS